MFFWWALEANSGTTPPNFLCTSWLATTLDKILLSDITAAEVSSQEDSIPKIFTGTIFVFVNIMLSVIKNIFSKNKKKKLLIFFFLILIVFFLIFKYLENNIQQIISNEFSKKSNYSLSLDDVDFKFSGNISVDNVVILNKEKDTVFYSPEIIVNSKSLQKVIINDELNFNNILIKDGFLKYENFDDVKTLKTIRVLGGLFWRRRRRERQLK